MQAKLLGAVGALLATAFLAGPAAAADKTKIDFWFGNSGDIAKRVQEQCDRFNQSQADYEVVCTSQGSYDASLQNTIAAFRAGKQPTIAQVSDAGTLDIMLSGAYYPANKLMSDMGYTVDWKDYFSGISVYYATSKGEMYSFPFNSSTALLYWNKDAFAKIGKDHAPATWKEAGEDLKALKDAGYACPLGFDISNNEVWQYIEQFEAVNGEAIATKKNGFEGLDAELVFNKNPLLVSYIKDLKSWYDNKLVVIKNKAVGQTFVEAFAAGDCQVILTSVGDHGNVGRTAKQGMNWDVAMLPTYGDASRHSSYVGGEYLKKQGFYDKAPYAGRELAIQSLTASPADDAAPHGIRLGGLLQVRTEIANGLQAIFVNNADVQASLDSAAERGNTLLRRFQQTYKNVQLP
ncbi:extracellular solute-binding protein [Rhizobium leguminosarum]|uniref:extracellular solute-binding protein n=1 Tax=Rhizobium leguminosarum TaxID=384 RepID=UPI001C96027F|nr:extracellular solute-binding protein [Rhizobium leguminosarum]MBY5710396.1 glycerol 3-phosphate ABC transporter [Rhizobium leguminosarum]